ncbi:MAG TPA: response regulator [Candidatus Limnocylindrales bacterium]|nr:response regulator [Candidatus Limnocylindrales bacterium]
MAEPAAAPESSGAEEPSFAFQATPEPATEPAVAEAASTETAESESASTFGEAGDGAGGEAASPVMEPEPAEPEFASEPEPSVEAEPAAEPAYAVEAFAETQPAQATPVGADDTQGQAPSEGGNEGGGSAGTMVIIEDDAAVAEYYATLFRGNGYRVEVANDGVSGVDLASKVQPAVIMLDVMMPRQNGILVLQTLRASDETKNTPVVVLSNFSEPTLIKRALQLGALEYVIKTQVEGSALLQAVPRWMNREKAFAA